MLHSICVNLQPDLNIPCPAFNCEYFRVTVSYLIVHVDTISLAKHYEKLNMESCLNCNNLTKRQTLKDENTGQIKHKLIQYSVRTINNNQVSRITYPHRMHALYEKRV